MSHYFVMFPFPGSSSTMNYFSGSLQSDLNTKCYGQGCSPCAVIIPEPITNQAIMKEMAEIAILYSQIVNDKIRLDVNLQKDESYAMARIFTLDGKLVYESANLDGISEIEVSGITEGIYLLEIYTNQRQEYRKVIVQH